MEFQSPLAETVQVSIIFLNQQISDLEKKKKIVDEEVKNLQAQLNKVVTDLATHLVKNPRLSTESSKRRHHRNIKRKLMTTSVVMTLSSIPVAVSSKFGMTSKTVLPWSVAIGTGSFLCSCYLAKDVLDNFKEYKSRPLARVALMDVREKIPELRIQSDTPVEDLNLDLFMNKSEASGDTAKTKMGVESGLNRKRLLSA